MKGNSNDNKNQQHPTSGMWIQDLTNHRNKISQNVTISCKSEWLAGLESALATMECLHIKYI